MKLFFPPPIIDSASDSVLLDLADLKMFPEAGRLSGLVEGTGGLEGIVPKDIVVFDGPASDAGVA